MNLGPLHWEHGVLTTGPPGKSQRTLFKSKEVTMSMLIHHQAQPLRAPSERVRVLIAEGSHSSSEGEEDYLPELPEQLSQNTILLLPLEILRVI